MRKKLFMVTLMILISGAVTGCYNNYPPIPPTMSGGSVYWNDLLGVPTGFADGVDDTISEDGNLTISGNFTQVKNNYCWTRYIDENGTLWDLRSDC